MEITFEIPSVTTKTVNIDEDDLEKLGSIISFLAIRHLQVAGLAFACWPEEEQAVELCRKYGIDPNEKGTVVNFFSALILNSDTPDNESQD